MSAVLEPRGGHTVTLGNGAVVIGIVWIEVTTGVLLQCPKDLLIRNPAPTKLKMTMRAQTTLAMVDFARVIWKRPWMVELSRNSHTTSIADVQLAKVECHVYEKQYWVWPIKTAIKPLHR